MFRRNEKKTYSRQNNTKLKCKKQLCQQSVVFCFFFPLHYYLFFLLVEANVKSVNAFLSIFPSATLPFDNNNTREHSVAASFTGTFTFSLSKKSTPKHSFLRESKNRLQLSLQCRVTRVTPTSNVSSGSSRPSIYYNRLLNVYTG